MKQFIKHFIRSCWEVLYVIIFCSVFFLPVTLVLVLGILTVIMSLPLWDYFPYLGYFAAVWFVAAFALRNTFFEPLAKISNAFAKAIMGDPPPDGKSKTADEDK